MIYTVKSEHGTHLAFEKRGKRGPSKITFFPGASLTARQKVEMAKQVRAKLRAFKAGKHAAAAEAPETIQ